MWNTCSLFFLVVILIQSRAQHLNNVIMGAMASQVTSLTIVYSSVYSGEDQRKHQRSASLAFVRAVHWWPVNSPHKWPITRKVFPFRHHECRYPPLWGQWMFHRGGKRWVFLHIYTVIVPIYGHFQDYSVKESVRLPCRREPLNGAHDSTFGILEHYHCWRFHGSGAILRPFKP